MNKRKACQARQYSDEMQCAECGLAWDVNDPEPPECTPEAPIPKHEPAPRARVWNRGQRIIEDLGL